MSLRLDGINPLAYMGVKPSQPPNLVLKSSAPTVNDLQNINIGTFWLVYPSQELWFLISVATGVATWVQLYPSGGGGGGATQFPTDDGIANEAGGILNILGDGNIITHGAGNTVTLTMAGDFVENFATDSGIAHPSSNTIRILGGTNINTSGTSNAVTVNLDDSVVLAGDLEVEGNTILQGGLQLTSQTDGVLQADGTGVVTATNGTDGQVLIGGNTAPAWANLQSAGGTVIITNGPNSINLESTGGGGGGSPISFYAYQNADYSVPASLTVAPLTYLMGSGLALITAFNNGGGFFPGDGIGTPASFTAPTSGSYFFTFNLAIRNGVAPNTNINIAFAQILTSVNSQTYSSLLSNNTSGGAFNYNRFNLSANVTLQLTAGDVVTFQAVVNSVNTANSPAYIVSGPVAMGGTLGSTTITSIEGFLVQPTTEAPSGGVAFFAYQPTVTTVNDAGGAAGRDVKYVLGANLSLTTTLNEGGAFYPGDGTGTGASFTAPVRGIYSFSNSVAIGRAVNSIHIINYSSQIYTPSLVFAGGLGDLSTSTQGVEFGSSNTLTPLRISSYSNNSIVLQLDIGDVVSFGVLVPGISSMTPTALFRVYGAISPLTGPNYYATYVQGYLIREL